MEGSPTPPPPRPQEKQDRSQEEREKYDSPVPPVTSLRVRMWLCPPRQRAAQGTNLGRPVWDGASAKLWPSWAMTRSTSMYGWASRTKPRCRVLWRCCPG